MIPRRLQYLLIFSALLLLAGVLSARSVTQAATEAFNLDWWTVDNGGGASQGSGAYQLSAAVGQPDAGPTMRGGDFALSGGFLPGAETQTTSKIPIFLPMVVR